MNDDRSLERAARAWIEEGPTVAPDRAVEATLAQIETTKQDRRQVIRWRLHGIGQTTRFLALAAVVVSAAVGGAILLSGGDGAHCCPNPRGPASPDASQGESSSPTPVASLELGSTFTSARYGYSMGINADWPTTTRVAHVERTRQQPARGRRDHHHWH